MAVTTVFYPEHPAPEKTHFIETTPLPLLEQEKPFRVKDFCGEFAEDADSFFAKYVDKRFQVTGIAKKVGPDAHNKPSIELSDSVDGKTCALVISLGKGSFVSLILGPDSGQPGVYAAQYLTVMSVLFWVNGTMFVLRNTLTGMGYSGYSVFSGICELIGKAFGGILAVKWLGFWGICVATPLAWFLAMVYCGILVRHFMGKHLASVSA